MPEEPSTAGAVTCVSCRCDSSARLPGLRAPSPEPWVLPAPPRVARSRNLPRSSPTTNGPSSASRPVLICRPYLFFGKANVPAVGHVIALFAFVTRSGLSPS